MLHLVTSADETISVVSLFLQQNLSYLIKIEISYDRDLIYLKLRRVLLLEPRVTCRRGGLFK